MRTLCGDGPVVDLVDLRAVGLLHGHLLRLSVLEESACWEKILARS
jgi:hypothetical protein